MQRYRREHAGPITSAGVAAAVAFGGGAVRRGGLARPVRRSEGSPGDASGFEGSVVFRLYTAVSQSAR